MKTNSLFRISNFLLLTIIVLSVSSLAFAQPKLEKGDVPLTEISEAILVNGKPSLKILSPKLGGYTEVKNLKIDGEEALIFSVTKLSMKNPNGKLFVTKTKIVFESYEKKDKNFSLNKSEIIKLLYRKSLDGYPTVQLDFRDEEAKLQVNFDRATGRIERASQRAVHSFLYRAIEDFDATLKEFKELTKSAYPSQN